MATAFKTMQQHYQQPDLAAREWKKKCGKDEVTPPELALRSALMIPGAKVIFYQDKTHMLIADNQQRIIDEIKLFIDQLNKAQVKN